MFRRNKQQIATAKRTTGKELNVNAKGVVGRHIACGGATRERRNTTKRTVTCVENDIRLQKVVNKVGPQKLMAQENKCKRELKEKRGKTTQTIP